MSRPTLGDETEPLIFFWFSAFVGLFILIAASSYPSASEQHGLHGHDDHTHNGHESSHEHEELSLSDKFALVWKVISIWRVQKVLLYIAFVTLSCANFEVFVCYSNEEQVGIKTIFEGSMATVVYFATTIWFALYNSVWMNKRNRYFILSAIIARYCSTWLLASGTQVNGNLTG